MVKHEIYRLHLRRSCDHATHGDTVYILNIWIWVTQFLFFFNLICRAFRWMFSAFLGYLAIFSCVDLTLNVFSPKTYSTADLVPSAKTAMTRQRCGARLNSFHMLAQILTHVRNFFTIAYNFYISTIHVLVF